jgi:hypothetical protein
MKKIIKTNSDTIFAHHLPSYPIIGAIDNKTKEKHFVVMTKYDDKSTYKIFCRAMFSKGNCYDGPEFIGELNNILNHPRLEFLLFDSAVDLFAWLATP